MRKLARIICIGAMLSSLAGCGNKDLWTPTRLMIEQLSTFTEK